jgi:hypothetical protein
MDNQVQLPTRRDALRRGALVAGATVWAAPAVQTIAAPAFAAGSDVEENGNCFGCLTGGGQEITDGSFTVFADSEDTTGNTVEAVISFGLSPICCDKRPGTELEVNAHPTSAPPGNKDGDASWHFDLNLVLTCTRQGDPGMPKACANVFTGTIQDDEGNTLSFMLADLGEPGNGTDTVKLVITDSEGRTTVNADGTLSRGNLQAHEDLGPDGGEVPAPEVVCNCTG